MVSDVKMHNPYGFEMILKASVLEEIDAAIKGS
jgi:hypothetical protein